MNVPFTLANPDLDPVFLKEAAAELSYESSDHLLEALGRGDLGPTAVMKALFPDHDPEKVPERAPSTLQKISAVLTRSDRGVRIPADQSNPFPCRLDLRKEIGRAHV